MRLQEWLLGKRATQPPALESHVHEGDGSAHAEPDSEPDAGPNAEPHSGADTKPDSEPDAGTDAAPVR